jgi:hypothetical protein
MAQDQDNTKLQRLSDLTKILTFTGNKSVDLLTPKTGLPALNILNLLETGMMTEPLLMSSIHSVVKEN